MHILVMNHVTARSGAEILLLRFLRLIDKKRFQITVALPSLDGMLPEELATISGISVQVVQADPAMIGMKRMNAGQMLFMRPKILLAFIDLVRQHLILAKNSSIDLFFSNSLKSHYYGSLTAFLARKPLVWYMHDIIDTPYFPKWTRYSLVLFANLFASKILCNSNATREALIRVGVQGNKLATVYPPMIEETESPEAESSNIRDELRISLDTRLITMVGRITAPKGQLEFIRAAQKIMSQKPNTLFLIVGDSLYGQPDDSYKCQVAEAIQSLPDPHQVLMLGARNDAVKIIAASDVVVMHSLWPEGLGLVVIEAMLCSRPIVAIPLGGISELIFNGKTGFCVEPGDTDGLAQAILKFLDDPQKASEIGKAALKYARQLLSHGNMEIFESALEDAIHVM